MKKRFLASTLAILMATGALATSASAAYDGTGFVNDPEDETQRVGTTGAGTAQITVGADIVLGSLIVQVPTGFDYVLNPYGLEYEIVNPDYDEEDATSTPTIMSTDKFFTKAGYMANLGDFDIDISIGLLAAPSAGSGLELIDSATEFTAKKVQAKLGLEVVEEGTLVNIVASGTGTLAEGVAGYHDPTFDFTGDVTDAGVVPATVKARVQPDDAADANFALAASPAEVTLAKKTVAKVQADGETAPDADNVEAGTRSTYAAVGLKLAADVNDNAEWKAADKFDAIVVWDIQRHFA